MTIYFVMNDRVELHRCGDAYTAVRVLHWLCDQHGLAGGQIQNESKFLGQLGVTPPKKSGMDVDLGGMVLMDGRVEIDVRDDLEIRLYAHQYLSILADLNYQLGTEIGRGFVRLEGAYGTTCLNIEDAHRLRSEILARRAEFDAIERKFLLARAALGDYVLDLSNIDEKFKA